MSEHSVVDGFPQGIEFICIAAMMESFRSIARVKLKPAHTDRWGLLTWIFSPLRHSVALPTTLLIELILSEFFGSLHCSPVVLCSGNCPHVAGEAK